MPRGVVTGAIAMKKIVLGFCLSLSLSTPAVVLIARSAAPAPRKASGDEVEAAVRHAEQELAAAEARKQS